jgi:hypothetical protein
MKLYLFEIKRLGNKILSKKKKIEYNIKQFK